jgi:hypothetical protein
MNRAILILILISGCSLHGEGRHQYSSMQHVAKSICEVMDDPSQYVGHRIIIKGTYFREPHRRLIYDDNCPEVGLSVSHSSNIDGDRTAARIVRRSFKTRPTGMVPVVYSAVLMAKILVSNCIKPSCYEYSLKEAQLLAASPQMDVPRRR